MKAYHISVLKNKQSISSTGLLPMIGKNSSALGETKEAVYLFNSIESLNDALSNWFGELYDDDQILSIFQVDITDLNLVINGYELISFCHINKERILHLEDI